MDTQQNQPHERNEPPPHEPSPNQFGLRGMFLLMTSLCLICAALSWTGFHDPLHLFGALAIIAFCAVTIGVIEWLRRLIGEHSPPPRYLMNPRFDNLRISRPPQHLFRGENPFREEPAAEPGRADSEEGQV